MRHALPGQPAHAIPIPLARDRRYGWQEGGNGVGGVNWSTQHLLIELYREVFDDIGTDVGFVGAPER